MPDETSTKHADERGNELQARYDALYEVASRAWDRSRLWNSVARWGFLAEAMLVFLTGIFAIGCAICSAETFLLAHLWLPVALSKMFLSCLFVSSAVAWIIERPARATQAERTRLNDELTRSDVPIWHFS